MWGDRVDAHLRGEASLGAGDELAEGFYKRGRYPDGAVHGNAVNLFQYEVSGWSAGGAVEDSMRERFFGRFRIGDR